MHEITEVPPGNNQQIKPVCRISLYFPLQVIKREFAVFEMLLLRAGVGLISGSPRCVGYCVRKFELIDVGAGHYVGGIV